MTAVINFFRDKGVVWSLPVFIGLLLYYFDKDFLLISIFIIANTLIYFLIVVFLVVEVKKSRINNDNDIYRALLNQRFGIFSFFTSLSQMITMVISLIILYPFIEDILAYYLFWISILGVSFYFLQAVIRGREIKNFFKNQPLMQG